MAKLTKALDVVWGCFAYGVGYSLGAIAVLFITIAEPIIQAGHRAKNRSRVRKALRSSEPARGEKT